MVVMVRSRAMDIAACLRANASAIFITLLQAMKNKSALAEVLMGSCCSHVVHRCPVPVVVVRNLPSVALATE
jgi:nucleotide-binding universal stress UspA family protein